jgi:hypothetical protein
MGPGMSDLKTLFKPEHFEGTFIRTLVLDQQAQILAVQAQAILNQALEKAERVYFCDKGEKPTTISKERFSFDTHQALLVCKEKLVPEEHEHEPYFYINQYRATCECGVTIKLKWEKV